MFDKSTHHGNDAVLLFLSRAILREFSTEMDVKTVNVIVKKKSKLIFQGLFKKSDSMLPCVCSVIDHSWCQNVVKNKEVAHESRASVSLMFLPHFDFFCDLLLNRIYIIGVRKKRMTSHQIWFRVPICHSNARIDALNVLWTMSDLPSEQAELCTVAEPFHLVPTVVHPG